MVSKRKAYQRYAAGGAVRAEATPAEVEAPAAVPAAEVEDTSASNAFQGQIDALRRAEARDAPVLPPDQEVEAAMRDLEMAFEQGDLVAQNRATNRMSRANTLLAQEQDLRDLRAAHQAQQHQPQPQHQLTERQQRFVLDHPEMVQEPERLSRAIQSAHAAGIEPDSDSFHDHVASTFRNQPAPAPTPKRSRERAVDDDADSGRGRIVSAPVSREWSGSRYGDRSDKVVMTPEMKDAARISGISETDYALQVLRLREAKKNGDYQGRP